MSQLFQYEGMTLYGFDGNAMEAIEELPYLADCVVISADQKDDDFLTWHVPARHGDGPACGLSAESGWEEIPTRDARDHRMSRDQQPLAGFRICSRCYDKLEEWFIERDRAQMFREQEREARQLEERLRKANLYCKPPERR